MLLYLWGRQEPREGVRHGVGCSAWGWCGSRWSGAVLVMRQEDVPPSLPWKWATACSENCVHRLVSGMAETPDTIPELWGMMPSQGMHQHLECALVPSPHALGGVQMLRSPAPSQAPAPRAAGHPLLPLHISTASSLPQTLPCAWGGNCQQKAPVGYAGVEEGSAGANGPRGKLWAQPVPLLKCSD